MTRLEVWIAEEFYYVHTWWVPKKKKSPSFCVSSSSSSRFYLPQSHSSSSLLSLLGKVSSFKSQRWTSDINDPTSWSKHSTQSTNVLAPIMTSWHRFPVFIFQNTFGPIWSASAAEARSHLLSGPLIPLKLLWLSTCFVLSWILELFNEEKTPSRPRAAEFYGQNKFSEWILSCEYHWNRRSRNRSLFSGGTKTRTLG